ncbi:hypothetical protein Marpi_1172 [Marinitoga piezophila KA3]|uniref:Uncharacterized protein n=1 Tax=Marinitoga piezophila (strain DSM 14283 / JCM 11233 / KA3) TaxID=443254 RepID=H2J898_MARPK|nr:hypothetical protein [Marinitoga piezophila]AEX85582.1 hypothetical protein Marpi_1172 [Marinitoga piezophila KA3]
MGIKNEHITIKKIEIINEFDNFLNNYYNYYNGDIINCSNEMFMSIIIEGNKKVDFYVQSDLTCIKIKNSIFLIKKRLDIFEILLFYYLKIEIDDWKINDVSESKIQRFLSIFLHLLAHFKATDKNKNDEIINFLNKNFSDDLLNLIISYIEFPIQISLI